MSLPLEPRTQETLAHVLEALRRAQRPLTGREISQAIPPPSRVDAGTLDQLLRQDPRVIAWPPKTASAPSRWWTRSPAEVVDSLLGELPEDASLTAGDLQKQVRRHPAGFSAAQRKELAESRVEALVAAGTLYVHPAPGRAKPRFGRKPPPARAYVAKLARDLDTLAARLKAYGISRDDLIEALRGAAPSGGLEQRIVEYLKTRPGGIGVGQLREELGLATAAKAAFDAAVLALYRQRRVYLDQHDFPLGLSDEARNELVRDATGNYFVVIGLRDADAESIP